MNNIHNIIKSLILSRRKEKISIVSSVPNFDFVVAQKYIVY